MLQLAGTTLECIILGKVGIDHGHDVLVHNRLKQLVIAIGSDETIVQCKGVLERQGLLLIQVAHY